MNVLEEIKNDITGAQAIADWLGGEPPVDCLVALCRADCCVQGNDGKPCLENVEPGWWSRHLKEPVARWITKELEEKNRMSIKTPHDDQLHICRVCQCCLALKVWTPASVLRRHVSKDKLNKMPSFCWQRKELL